MQQSRIKFYCRSFNKELYLRSKHLYEMAGYPCVRLTDQTADGYFYTMLRDTDCDIAINVDEDAFISDLDAVMRLVDYVIENGYANAGNPEGGSGSCRHCNPLVTNPFFNIFNLKMIREKFSEEAVRQFSYAEHRAEMEAAYPKHLLVSDYNFAIDDQEPYYPFFFWQAYHFKTLYLPALTHEDTRTTLLCLPAELGETPFCVHTWFARFYNMPTWLVKRFQQKDGYKQKMRIDARMKEAYDARRIALEPLSWGVYVGIVFDRIARWAIKIPQRIAGWPAKWKKRRNKKNAKK